MGTRIEHFDRLGPGIPSILEFAAANGSAGFSGQIVWSRIVGSEPTSGGEGFLRDKSGLGFAGITSQQQDTLAKIMEQHPHGR